MCICIDAIYVLCCVVLCEFVFADVIYLFAKAIFVFTKAVYVFAKVDMCCVCMTIYYVTSVYMLLKLSFLPCLNNSSRCVVFFISFRGITSMSFFTFPKVILTYEIAHILFRFFK